MGGWSNVLAVSATSPVDTPSGGDTPQAATAPNEPASTETAEKAAAPGSEQPDAEAPPEPPQPPHLDEPGQAEASIEAIIKGSIDDALARWDAAFGIGDPDQAEAEAEAGRDLDGFDARQHLAAASTRAVNRYLAERGLSPEGGATLFKPTPAFIAEHGVPLMSAVFGALEQAMSSALTEVVHGRKPTQLEPEGRIQLDLSDLFGPEEP